MAVGHIKLESPENTEEMVKEKLQRVNEPGEVVKCLFDPMTMDDIADNFPENLRNAGHKPIMHLSMLGRRGGRRGKGAGFDEKVYPVSGEFDDQYSPGGRGI